MTTTELVAIFGASVLLNSVLREVVKETYKVDGFGFITLTFDRKLIPGKTTQI